MAKPAKDLTRADLLAMIAAHVNSRPGFDWHNYGDATSYRADMRTASQQKADALAMLAAVGYRDAITADQIRAELQRGNRLTLDDSGRLEYCTGQYYPTEYRAGACRVLSALLWDFWRDADCTTGDAIRAKARKELGRGVAARWFR